MDDFHFLRPLWLAALPLAFLWFASWVGADGPLQVLCLTTLALVAAFETVAAQATGDPSDVANRLVLAVVLGVIGLPLWWMSWSRIRRQCDADPSAEIGSLTRRLYLVVLFGAGGLTPLISLIVVLFVGIDDLLDEVGLDPLAEVGESRVGRRRTAKWTYCLLLVAG